MEQFYFRSFDRTIGVACDVLSLYYEMKCLSLYDNAAVNYHVKEGHLSMWLDYIGEHDLAESIRTEKEIESVLNILETKIKKNTKGKSGKGGMQRGQGNHEMKQGQKHKERMVS
ncbi:hypothetical protein [Ferroplasma sp.]|uniref:hypothetical protein n=1 Tax=Ferroplasma sp. TaxID=2591003 RepID=UPI002622A6C2|nr:hypothetical protein [Ferroplasma sp.]MCL4453898.1 hypothetical protein [Candidatus Thermoplasmatota archaeon]